MKKTRFVLALLSLGLCGFAGPVLTLDPASGAIQGSPGDTPGWGFTLSSDPVSWISVVTTSLFTESNSSLGFYTDYAGLLGGPANGVLAPGAPDWVVPFDAFNQLGLGAFSIDPGAPVGAIDAGLLDLNYETFSADPNLCGNCATGFFDVFVPFQVQAVEAAPEPAAGWLIGGALLLLGVVRRKRR